MQPALVILAAGASRRLGTCKALVPLAGSTPLALLASAGRAAAADALVVTGPDDAAIRRALPEGVEAVHNRAWQRGRSGSLALAARLRPGRDLLVAPVDVPLVPARVFAALARAWERAGAPAQGWLAPSWSARPDEPARFGHPVLIGRGLAAELASWDPDRPLRELRARADPLLAETVDSPAILADLDDPADLARLRAECPER